MVVAAREKGSAQSRERQRFSVVVLGRRNDFRVVGGRTLVERAARAALLTGAAEVVVVIPDKATLRGLSNLPIRIVRQRECIQGRNGSLQAGLRALRIDVDAIVVALADQPRVTARHLRQLASRVLSEDSVPIVASRYEAVLGAPCAFHASMLPMLMALEGPEGARPFIRSHPELVQVLDFATAEQAIGEDDPYNLAAKWRGVPAVLRRPSAASSARAPPLVSIPKCAI